MNPIQAGTAIYHQPVTPFTIAAFYRFVALPSPAALRDHLRDLFIPTDLCGTLLIAPEGINGTLAGTANTIDRLLTTLATPTGLTRDEVKFAIAEEKPFGRLKIKLKPEILTFRNVAVDPNRPGTYVEPQDWNHLIASPDVLLLDTRNTYETEIGTFANSVDPHLNNFSDFVTYVRQNLDPATTPKVAMFCTGGIRCEKASAFMLQEGFTNVYHLRGGILRYLEEVSPTDSLWQGECFVFDRRRSVAHADFSPTTGKLEHWQPGQLEPEHLPLLTPPNQQQQR